MELTYKILIQNKKQTQDLINEWDNNQWRHFLQLKDFEKYPALVCYYEDYNYYGMSYTATAYYSITYLDDFEL